MTGKEDEEEAMETDGIGVWKKKRNRKENEGEEKNRTP